MKKIEVRGVRRARRDDLLRLYREAGWWKPASPPPPGYLDALVKGSTCFVGAFCGGRMIGMGRGLSDGVSDAYIQDVTVLDGFRERGIGKRIIAEIVGRLRRRGVDWIGLIAEPGSLAFYRRLGFVAMRRRTPMRWRGR